MSEQNQPSVFSAFPKGHLLLVGILLSIVVLATLFIYRPTHSNATDSTENKELTPLKMPASMGTYPPLPLPAEQHPSTPQTTYIEKSVTIKSGDTFAAIMDSLNQPNSLVHSIMQSPSARETLSKIQPKKSLTYYFTANNQLSKIKYAINDTDFLSISIDGNLIDSSLHSLPLDSMLHYAEGTITDSLFLAGQNAGLSNNIIMKLASIFGWDIDFVYDIRSGDHFELLYESFYLENEKVRDGEVLAASFTSQGKTFQAIRYQTANGDNDYFTLEGRTMRKEFMRTPVDFTRISSRFNRNRLHPVFKTRRPHNGIDYAASRGTPVYSSGAGRVIKASYSKANGNHVFIQHGSRYVTKYLHLHRRYVRTNQRVRQGQTIGTVGSTGYATGPHLHYEFLVNGVHRNPLTVKLPKAKSLPKAEHEHFFAIRDSRLTQMSLHKKLDAIAAKDF